MSYCANCNGTGETNPGEPCQKCATPPVATNNFGCPHWFQRHPCDICLKDNPKYAESVKRDVMTDRELHNAWRDLRGVWSKEDWIDFYETLKAFKARVVARSQRPQQTQEQR